MSNKPSDWIVFVPIMLGALVFSALVYSLWSDVTKQRQNTERKIQACEKMGAIYHDGFCIKPQEILRPKDNCYLSDTETCIVKP